MACEYDVIIVGSGIGGLTCACLLSKEGLKVLVLERLDRVGGCCSNYEVNGFKPEVGAVMVMGSAVYHKLFELLDRRLEDYLDLRPVDPVYDFRFLDGRAYLLPRDSDAMVETISTISPSDAHNYRLFCTKMKRVHDYYRTSLTYPLKDLRQLNRFSTLVRMAANEKLFAALPTILRLLLGNVDKVFGSYFRDPRIQFMLAWESIYAGLSPSRANGILAMIPYIGRSGYYYPKGGMISIPRALKRIAAEFGAEIRLNAPVERIVIENRQAKGVKLVNGETVTSRAVVSNAHSRVTYLDLVGVENLPGWAWRTIRRAPCSIPAPVLHIGLRNPIPDVRAHISVVASDKDRYEQLWRDSFEKRLLGKPADGFYLVLNPCMDDPDLAPAGKQILSLMFIGPYRLKEYDWDEIADEWSWKLISFMDKDVFPGLAAQVEWLDSVTPKELERRLNMPEGSFLGLELNWTNIGPYRPGYRSPLVKRLYLTGQCTNPGGGIPLVMTSGMIASSVLMNDWIKVLKSEPPRNGPRGRA